MQDNRQTTDRIMTPKRFAEIKTQAAALTYAPTKAAAMELIDEIARLRAAYKAAAEHGNNCYADTLRLAHCDVGFCQCGKAPEMTKQAACATPGTLRHLLDQEARGILAQTTTQDETTKPRVQDIAVTIAEQATEIACLRAALAAREWQPIETAPRGPMNILREGPTVLLCGGFFSDGKPCVRSGHWKAARTNAWCDSALGRCPIIPTHWQPLPDAPVTV